MSITGEESTTPDSSEGNKHMSQPSSSAGPLTKGHTDRRRNLFTEPWTVTHESTLFGAWWVIVPTADTDKEVPRPNAATIDTCGHQHQSVDALNACTTVAQLRETTEAHAEGLTEYNRRITTYSTAAERAAAFRRVF